ncbi:MAG: ribosomal RNA small subunit methyltransferase A, partial [Proteobacteria bacterium]|nr:ribosomal RNA small subunit methyltransferase A [Pseudomonadota bacterium]
MGQHFLNDYLIAEQITALANIGPNSSVVEIGPGSGNL